MKWKALGSFIQEWERGTLVLQAKDTCKCMNMQKGGGDTCLAMCHAYKNPCVGYGQLLITFSSAIIGLYRCYESL